jgi:hypothetical protein
MAEVQKTQPRAAASDVSTDADGESTPKRTGRRRMKRMIRKVVRTELRRAGGAAAQRRNPARRWRLIRKMRRLARLLRRN